MNRKIKGFIKEKLWNILVVANDSTGKPAKYVCHADPDAETKCQYFQIVFNSGNFKRHVITHHRRVAERLGLLTTSDSVSEEGEPEAKKCRSCKIAVETSRKQILLGTIQLPTLHNLPLSFPDWTGMQNLVYPLWKSAGLDISRYNLSRTINLGATFTKQRIRNEMTGRAVHLKIDLASRGGRHVLGINVQFMTEENIVQIRNLALHEMIERASKENILQILNKVMTDYGITIQQVLSVTHDNEQNMVASVKLLKKIVESSDVTLVDNNYHCLKTERNLLDEFSKNTSENATSDESDDESENDTDEHDELNDDFIDGQKGSGDIHCVTNDDSTIEIELIESTRCAVHTAQLAVWDVLKSYKARMAVINKIGITMRHKLHRQLFSIHKVSLPPKVVETRWNIWYLLNKYFEDLKDHPILEMLKNQDSSIDLGKQWTFIEKFCEAFYPVFTLTLKLQKEHVPLSQFYADWLVCQAQINNVASNNNLALKLLKTMKMRIQTLKNTAIFKANLFLDPRFNFAGTGRMSIEDKLEAQKYLLALDKRLDDICGRDTPDAPDISKDATSTDDSIERYLSDFFHEESFENFTNQIYSDPLIVEITRLETREKVNITDWSYASPQPSTSKETNGPVPATPSFNIVEYWKKRRYTYPQLYRLAQSVLSAPSTQVSVERLFSHFKNVLTDNRMRLSSEVLNDIMILKMNSSLLSSIVDDLDSELGKTNEHCI